MTMTGERRAIYEVERGVTLPDPAHTVSGADVVYRERRHLKTSYFDTADLRLLRRGLTLARVVEPAHDHDRWCLELPLGTEQARYRRREVCWPGESVEVPPGAKRLVAGVTRGRPLEMVAELVILRNSTELRDRQGTPLVSMADDAVTATSATSAASGDFRQVEVEIGEGDASIAEPLLDTLERGGARRRAGGPVLCELLADRLHLARHQDVGAAEPSGAPSVRSVVAAAIGGGLERLLEHEVGVRLDEDPEFVHQARVAVRRLRADLKTFQELLEEGWTADVRAELKWLGGALGDVRDADVLAERLSQVRHELAPEAGVTELGASLAARRQAAMARLEQVLDSRRYLDLVGRLDAAAHVVPWRVGSATSEVEAPSGARTLMDRAWRSWRKAAGALEIEPSDVEMHKLRIKTKRLRYATESLSPILGRRAEKLTRSAAALQELLGDHQDAVVGARAMWELAESGTPALAFAAGQFAALEAERRRAARQDWRRRLAKVTKRGTRLLPDR